jgi:hypothetical protein
MTSLDIESDLHIRLDLNVLNHLGIGLYSNTPAVLTEIIANAWDADADEVRIDIDNENDVITIRDNGIGMDHSALQNKFLTVGYSRRDNNEEKTPRGRQCMGRKGIGKLAMFSLADEIHLVSRGKASDPEGFVVYVDDLKDQIKSGLDYFPEKISDCSQYEIFPTGTTIILKQLNKSVSKTSSYLRRRIARRFSVIGGGSGKDAFRVYIDGSEVTIKDRGFYSDIQLLWTFGDQEEEAKALCDKHVRHSHYGGEISSTPIKINGFIASVEKPQQLKSDGDNNNTITLLANGRVFDEDVQKRLDDSKVFNSYLVGELQVDYFDSNDQPDMAVSSRQGVHENDPRFESFLGYLRTQLVDIGGKWDEWRREIGSEDVVNEFPRVNEWIETLSLNHKKRAKQLIGKINTMRFSGTPDDQKSQKKEVLKHQILAFEKLKIQDNIEAVEGLSMDQNIQEFGNILVSIEDIEAALHHDIIEQRLAVVRKLEQHNQNKVKERVVQEHIYNHLWLVDPSWEHKENETDFEWTLSEYLKRACPDTEDGARLDIGYRTTNGRYIVIELKKPGVHTSIQKLTDQGTRYSVALQEYFIQNPGSCPISGKTPVIEIVFLVDKAPQYPVVPYEGILKSINATITTYTDLINQSLRAYDAYLASSKKVAQRGIVWVKFHS